MVEKQAGVEVFFEVDPKAAAVLVHNKIFACFAGFLILLRAFLTRTPFQMNGVGRKSGYKRHRFQHFRQPFFVFFRLHQPAGVVFLQMDLAAVHIDRKRILRNVAVIQPPGFDTVAACPFQLVFGVFAQAVGKCGDVAHVFRRPLSGYSFDAPFYTKPLPRYPLPPNPSGLCL